MPRTQDDDLDKAPAGVWGIGVLGREGLKEVEAMLWDSEQSIPAQETAIHVLMERGGSDGECAVREAYSQLDKSLRSEVRKIYGGRLPDLAG